MANAVIKQQASELAKQALDSRLKAYAPYSNFRVGAAILCKSGDIITGCNVENVSYGVSICAERTAIVAAVAAGHQEFEAMAVASHSSPPVPPCGACRQFIAEFAPNLPIFLVNDHDQMVETNLSELLPGAFSKRDLKNGQELR